MNMLYSADLITSNLMGISVNKSGTSYIDFGSAVESRMLGVNNAITI
jgi:hypothetical protein